MRECVCVGGWTCICMRISIHICMFMSMFVRMYTRMCIHVWDRVCIRACVHVCLCAYVHATIPQPNAFFLCLPLTPLHLSSPPRPRYTTQTHDKLKKTKLEKTPHWKKNYTSKTQKHEPLLLFETGVAESDPGVMAQISELLHRYNHLPTIIRSAQTVDSSAQVTQWHTHTYIHAWVHTYINSYIHARAYVPACTHTQTHTHMHV